MRQREREVTREAHIERGIKRGDITRFGNACKGIKPLIKGERCSLRREKWKMYSRIEREGGMAKIGVAFT